MKSFIKTSLSVFLAITIIFSSVYVGLGEIDFNGSFVVEAEAVTGDCLEDMSIIEFGQYDDNEGDSTIFNLNKTGLTMRNDGKTFCANGNTGLNGETFENGFEAWIARWNYTDEISWAYAIFDIGGNYNTLTGKTSLIESYNTTNFDTTIYFYDGDTLLASYRLTNTDYKKDIEVDVTGVEELKLYVKDNVAVSGGTSFAIYNLFFDKKVISDTENIEYNIPRAEYYADNFSDFMIIENSYFADTFLNSLQDDAMFMGEVAVWESLHIAESPADSAERGLITKADYYQTVLFDLIISKEADSVLDVLEPIYKEISKGETSFTVKVIQSILEDDPTNSSITLENFTSLPLDSKLKDSIKSCFSDESVLSGVTTILGIHSSLYKAICTVSDYFALKNVCDSTIEVLSYIANDTNNDSALRSAASECIEHVGYGFDIACKNILDGTANLTEDVLKIYVNNVWESLISKIPVVNLVYCGIVGGRAMINAVFSEDKKIACYYQLEASVACENALLRAMNELKTVFLADKTFDNANYYMKSVDMYKSTVLLGYDYSIELIETIANCGLNIIFGSYNEAIESINNIRQSKGYKINNYNKFEELAFKVYLINYCPEYYETLKHLDGTYVPITSMEISQIRHIYVGESYSIDDSFSINYLPKNNTEEYMNITVTSSDESILKVVETEITAVGEGICTLTFVSEDERFCVTKSVAVYEYPENGYDYLLYFSYSINEDNQTVTITDYTGDLTHVVVPLYIGEYKVTCIGQEAFAYCSNIKTVTMPHSITSIGKYAFYECISLTSIDISNNVTNIGDYAFAHCDRLTSVTIPYNVTSLGKQAFMFCTSLISVSIPDSISVISSGLFSHCRNLTSVTISESTTHIGDEAFLCCDNLTSITIPDSVTSIGRGAFSDCYNLTLITIPNTVTSIGDDAFCETGYYRDSNNWENNVLYIDNYLIKARKTISGTYEIKSGTVLIANEAFYDCDSLISITIPDSLTIIGDYAFYDCYSLKSVTIPNSVTNIGNWTFYNCISLNSIIIPEGVTNIGDGLFYNCPNLISITIPDSVINIGYYAFFGCRSLTTVTMGKSISTIDYRAFYGCTELLSVTIPKTITNIGNQALGYYLNSTDKNVKINNFIIYGIKNTASENYAKENGFTFINTCEHNANKWFIDKKATVYSTGSKHKECTECGEVLETAEISQLKCSKPKLKTIANTEYGVKITWGKVSGADRYRVYRKTSKSDWKYIGYTSKTGYTDKTAKSGTKYYYAIKARNEAGDSSLSSSLSKLYLADPTLKTPSSSKTGVKLTWSKVSGANGYMVYRKTGTGSYTKIATVKGSTKVTYTDKSAKKGKKYTYKIKAYKSKTYSAYSNAKAITDKY